MAIEPEQVDPDSGEVFVLISAGSWHELVAAAARQAPSCAPGCASCDVARAVLAVETDRARQWGSVGALVTPAPPACYPPGGAVRPR